MYFTLTKRPLYRNALFIFTAVLFFSCQKELSIENGASIQLPDLKTKVSSSVSGFVTDENDAALMGATVQFGTTNITTDKYGYFEAKNVQVVKNAAFVTVTKPGYFKGIKTYMAKEGKAAFFRIKLIPKTNVGNINGTSGGSVTLTNGLGIALPSGAVVNAATNAAYTGTVNVAAYWINPEAADLNSIMPGDLRGIDKNGSMKLLQTFGMAAVELTGASGELLQIAPGKKATLTLTIPASLAASAPASIPLWYFDETKGLWKEEGNAVKTGNTYVGDVNHFSFWNYDVPGNFVQFDCTLKDVAGNPLPFMNVLISIVGTNNSRWGYTNSSGYVGGLVPANTQLLMEAFANLQCFTPIYSQAFTTTNSNISLGDLTVVNSPIATVSGSLTNCSNQAVTNGCVIMLANYNYYRYDVNSSGNFIFNTIVCGGSAVVDLIGVDISTLQEGYMLNYNLVSGNNIANIQACGASTQEFVNYSVNGIPFTIIPPGGQISEYDSIANNSRDIYAYVSNTVYTHFGISNLNIGTGSVQDLIFFQSPQTGLPTIIPTPISVNITEYGSIGQFISGNFSGIVTGSTPPNTTYNIICSFRYRRAF
jgi:hypothetical protein